jgi:hypothetical protein
MATYNGYTTDQLRAFVDQYFSNPNSADVQFLLNQGLISNTNPDTLLYFGLTNMLGFSPDVARSAVSDVFAPAPQEEPPSNEPPPSYEPPYEPPPVYQPPPVYTATDGTTFSSEADRNNYQSAINAQQKLRSDAQAIGVNLPSSWFVMTPQQQFDWYVSNKFGSDKLKALGVTDANLLKAVDDAIKPVTVTDVVNTISQPIDQNQTTNQTVNQQVNQGTTTVTAPTLQSWQKLDASGNIVDKTMADYTFTEMVPFAQNLISQQQAAGKYITPDEFRVFAGQQGVPDSQMAALIASLNFPAAPVTNQPTTNTTTTTGPKPLSAYTSAEMIPYIQNLFRDNPSATAQMVRQYAMSQNVPASVIDAALSGVQVPTANFSQFTVGGGNTRLATPTTDFFYGAGPTQQAPYMFKSGAAGYTRLLPQSLEFGVPVATGTKPVFTPGIFDKTALQKAYEAQTGQSYGGEVIPANDITQASYMGGKITPDKIAYEKGGKVKGLLGPKPDSPDDGYASLQVGEYVIRKKAVNKYGEDFLEALNESRIPKKKAKGLL